MSVPSLNEERTIRQTFEQVAPLTDADWEAIRPCLRIRQVSRGAFLLQQGDVCDYLGIMTRGALRTYNVTYDGEDRTGWLTVKRMFTTEVLSFYSREPTLEYVEAVQDVEIWYLTHADLQSLYLTTPAVETFGRKFSEDILTELKGHLLSQLHDPAPQRYERLLRLRPDFFRLIPLKYIASFLGMAPSTLSRIRSARATAG